MHYRFIAPGELSAGGEGVHLRWSGCYCHSFYFAKSESVERFGCLRRTDILIQCGLNRQDVNTAVTVSAFQRSWSFGALVGGF